MHTSLSVKGLNLSRSFDLNNVLAVPTLPDLSDSIPREMDVLNYSYLNGIKFAELNCKDIDLLIGADMQAIHQAYESRHGPEGQPTAVLTGLGWTLVGPDQKMCRCKMFSGPPFRHSSLV